MKKIVNDILLPLLSISTFTILFQWSSNESLMESVVNSTIITGVVLFVPRLGARQRKE
ncbi:hypothetical protein [Marinifilum caeruleilacunae]|uniref:hypothetical protein n=1 Tax=Marinifilum caeruleilacunae TaxID=2499076 RepID=UPI00149293B1|nr:hypothetical protein [Marinifilum caeruleilacunae]